MTSTAPPARRPPLPVSDVPAEVHPPPFLLPGEHFVAALLWLVIGAGGLILVAPRLATGNIFDPHVVAVTHSFTLGFITTAIFGALYQLFPVALGRAVLSVRVGHLTFWLLQAGIVLIVGGFWLGRGRTEGMGWVVIALATGCLGVNLISQGVATRPDPIVGRYVGAGYLALVAALALGSLRIGETLGYWHVDRFAMIASHFHLAALGFATCVAMGVGSRLLPMFLVSHGSPRWPLRWSGPVGGAGLLGFVIGQFAQSATLILAGGGLLGVALLTYLFLARDYFRRRVRRTLDPGLAHVAVAFTALASAVGVGGVLLASRHGFHPQGWAVYALLLLLGWLVLLIVGVLYKILPFLTWLHLFGPRMGERSLPTVADLTRPAWGWWSLTGLVTGLAVLIPAVGFGAEAIARIGAAGFGLGIALVVAQAGRVLYLRIRP